MSHIEPIDIGSDRRTFDCDRCGRNEQLLVKS
jgi:hypothetical protein